MASSGTPPKAMSDRLRTMKFMQRASAASSGDQPSEEPPMKRLRASDRPAPSSQSPASKRDSVALGETKWYLSFHSPQQPSTVPLQTVSAGFSVLDREVDGNNASGEEARDKGAGGGLVAGRKRFGKFKPQIVQADGGTPPSSDSSLDSDGEEGDDPHGVRDLIAQGRRDAIEKIRAEQRPKETDIRGLGSISSGGKPTLTCRECGKRGHKARDCPARARPSSLRKTL